MKNSLSLSVPKPCSEKWENFKPAGNGAYCGSCSKVVVDFTTMSDAEVMAFFRKPHSKTCGRFKLEQLKTYDPIATPKVHPGYKFLRAGLMSLMLTMATRPSTAMNSMISTEQTVNVSQAHAVRGIVVDAENTPLPGVNVVKKGTPVGTTTDVNGKFTFPEQLENGEVLIFSLIGPVVEYTVSDDEDVTIVIGNDNVTVLGDGATDDLYGEKLVKGTVTDEDDKTPLPGIDVHLKGTSIGTQTDEHGEFLFPQSLNEGDVLEFSFIGYRTKEYKIKSTDSFAIEVNMTMNMEVLGELVLGGAVAGVDMKPHGLFAWLRRIF